MKYMQKVFQLLYHLTRSSLHRIVICCSPLCFVLLLGLQGCEKNVDSAPPQQDAVKQVKMLTITGISQKSQKRELPGKTKAAQEAELAFRVAGPLVELNVIEGQAVKKGELLARIDPRDFETTVMQAAASLQATRAELKAMKIGARPEQIQQFKANVQARRAELQEVKSQYSRYQQLYKDKVISKQQLDTIQAKYNVAQSQLESAQQQLKEGQKGSRQEDIEAQESQVQLLDAKLSDARNKLSDTELRAPFDGYIARTYVENFEDVQAKQPILSMQDLSQIEILVNIAETDVGIAQQSGLTIKEFTESLGGIVATFPAYPGREFPVQLKSYETEADSITQTFQTTFIMPQPEDATINPGMNVTISGYIDSLTGNTSEILVPAGAVFADSSGTPNVWVVTPETMQVASRQVQTGVIQHENIQILKGLNTGEGIVISAVQMLREGMKVKQMTDPGEL